MPHHRGVKPNGMLRIGGTRWRYIQPGLAEHPETGVRVARVSPTAVNWEVLLPSRDPGVRRVHGSGRGMTDAIMWAIARGQAVERARLELLAAWDEALSERVVREAQGERAPSPRLVISDNMFMRAWRVLMRHSEGNPDPEAFEKALSVLDIEVKQ